jgi:hypothetical protein
MLRHINISKDLIEEFVKGLICQFLQKGVSCLDFQGSMPLFINLFLRKFERSKDIELVSQNFGLAN